MKGSFIFFFFSKYVFITFVSFSIFDFNSYKTLLNTSDIPEGSMTLPPGNIRDRTSLPYIFFNNPPEI